MYHQSRAGFASEEVVCAMPQPLHENEGVGSEQSTPAQVMRRTAWQLKGAGDGQGVADEALMGEGAGRVARLVWVACTQGLWRVACTQGYRWCGGTGRVGGLHPRVPQMAPLFLH